jgi:hypothetical protein
MQRGCDHMVPAGLADSALDRKAMSAVQRSSSFSSADVSLGESSSGCSSTRDLMVLIVNVWIR